MKANLLNEYQAVRENGGGFYEQKRGLIEVSGAEAEMFLNGLITNDVKKLAENSSMLAAFPNAQGRLLAVVRVWRKNGKFYFDTEEKTHETVLKNLQRFTLAGNFFVNDLSDKFAFFSIRGKRILNSKFQIPNSRNETIETEFKSEKITVLNNSNLGENEFYFYVPKTQAENFKKELQKAGFAAISDQTFEILRIEAGLPLYGIDVDETTIVPEIGLTELISYNKGCYIGQEIIARIHFRGHVAKKLTGLVFENEIVEINPGDELKSMEGKNAGRVTSVTFSPKLSGKIALAYVRYDYLAEGTEVKIKDFTAHVKDLPFVR